MDEEKSKTKKNIAGIEILFDYFRRCLICKIRFKGSNNQTTKMSSIRVIWTFRSICLSEAKPKHIFSDTTFYSMRANQHNVLHIVYICLELRAIKHFLSSRTSAKKQYEKFLLHCLHLIIYRFRIWHHKNRRERVQLQ